MPKFKEGDQVTPSYYSINGVFTYGNTYIVDWCGVNSFGVCNSKEVLPVRLFKLVR